MHLTPRKADKLIIHTMSPIAAAALNSACAGNT